MRSPGTRHGHGGLEQAERYLAQLEAHFGVLAAGTVHERIVFEHRSDLRVTRCRHHFVFFVRAAAGVLILAVFHERMDLMARLRDRLETTESSG